MLTIVTGPPCAGKTTHVTTHAKPNDIVLDFDNIAQALTINAPSHNPNQIIRAITYKAWIAALDEALTQHQTNNINVWIIHADPPNSSRAKYRQHNARFIEINPGRSVCLERANERPANIRNATKDQIRAYYLKHHPNQR